MAINPSTNGTMSGRVTAADANYPYASSKDETSAGANDGTPYFKARADDIFGLQQSLLSAASIVPSGNADNVVNSQYLESLVELISGRAEFYDETGAADAYVLAVKTNQYAPQSLFDGLTVAFEPTNANTGASTINVAGLGVKDLQNSEGNPLVEGDLLAGERINIIFNSAADDWFLLPQLNNATVVDLKSARSGRNEILNGDFLIAQQPGPYPSGGYTADQFKIIQLGSSSVVTVTEFPEGQTDVPGNPKNYLSTVVTSVVAPNNFVSLQHPIADVRTGAGEVRTLSFWARADAPKDIATTYTQSYGTGGAPSGNNGNIQTTVHSLTTAWQRFVIPGFTIPSISGKTIGTDPDSSSLILVFWFDADAAYDPSAGGIGQQSGTFEISDVQQEPGTVPTDYDRRDPQEVLSDCQWFLNKNSVRGRVDPFPASAAGLSSEFPRTMRATPSVSASADFGTLLTTQALGNGAAYFEFSAGDAFGNFGCTFTAESQLL